MAQPPDPWPSQVRLVAVAVTLVRLLLSGRPGIPRWVHGEGNWARKKWPPHRPWRWPSTGRSRI